MQRRGAATTARSTLCIFWMPTKGAVVPSWDRKQSSSTRSNGRALRSCSRAACPSATRTPRRAVAFAEQAPIARRQPHPERAAVLQPERQRPANQRNIGDLEIRGSFDPVQARDRHAVAFKHALIARDRVAHVPQDGLLVHELSGTRQLLN